MSVFDHNEIELPCPNCEKHTFKESIAKLKRNRVRTCPRCKREIEFDPTDLARKLKKIEQQFRKMGFE